MNESQIVNDFFLPSHEQSSRAIGPTVDALDDPASCAAAFATGGPLAVAWRQVESVSATCDDSLDRRPAISLIQAKVWLAASVRVGAGQRDGGQRFSNEFLIVSVRAGNCDTQRHASTIGEDRTLDPQFATIGRIFAGLFPPRGAPWSWPRPSSASSNRCLCVGRISSSRPSITAATRLAEPTLENNDARCWHCRTLGAGPSTGNLYATRKRFRWPQHASLYEAARRRDFADTSEVVVPVAAITSRGSAQTYRSNRNAYTPPCKEKEDVPSCLTHGVAICSLMG
jgi:hypothetical protein